MPKDQEEMIRYSANIPKSLNDRINKYVPWGVKGEVLRHLFQLLDSLVCESENGLYVPTDLLDNKLELRYKQDSTRK